MGLKSSATDQEIIAYCKENFHRDGELEFDSTHADDGVSRGSDNGCYVQAWCWVDFDEPDEDEGEGEGEDEAAPAEEPDRVFNAHGICVEEWGPEGRKVL